MKKIVRGFFILTLVAAGTSGCTQAKTPVPKESAPVAQVPVHKTVSATAVKTEAAVDPVQGAALDLEKSLTAEGVTSAVQSSTQDLVRKSAAVADGVTSAAESSAQDAARDSSAIVGGVTSAAESSSQELARETSVVMDAVTSAAQSSSQAEASGKGETPA